jgi:hypothetical protein
MDRDTLIRDYIDLRCLNWDYVKNRIGRITEDMRRIRAMCDMEGITQEELDAAWEAWQRGERK